MRLILLAFLSVSPAASAEGTVAFFGLHMADTSRQTTVQSTLVPEDLAPGDLARLEVIEAMAAQRFLSEGYTLLDLAPVSADLDRVVNPAQCYGCDTRMAAKLGAQFILVGEVTKVSEALLALNLQLRDGQTGEIVKAGAVDIRGNTDDTWTRGMRYILNNRIFREAKQ
ncbi:MAG: DUF3280 domain-containing protein [Pseudomonadota bacterium]